MYTLHGMMCSYYTAKTRAYLSYKHIPFVETHDASVYQERMRPVVGFTRFPVLENDDGEVIQDTTVIIDALENRYPERPAFPDDPVLMLVTRIVEFFIDEFWVVTAMHTRWNDPDGKRFATNEFYMCFGDEGDEQEDWSCGAAVSRQMQAHLPGLGISTESGQQVIQRLLDEATPLLNKAVGPRKFAFGERASLIDCCLFTGYFAHHYRDNAASQHYLKTEAPELSYFLDSMQAAFSAPADGELAMTDEFLAYLKYIGPIAAAWAMSARQLAQPILEQAQQGEALQQSLPTEIQIFEQTFKRGTSIFTAWKGQRIQEQYETLSDNDRKRADELMAQIGWDDFLSTPIGIRMERVGYDLQRSPL
jgi:glutathione S-transferase